MAFHWQNGWFFGRDKDGSVRVQHHAPPHDGMDELGFPVGEPDMCIAIPGPEWASIVASVSAADETSVTYEVARAFHEGVRPQLECATCGKLEHAHADETHAFVTPWPPLVTE